MDPIQDLVDALAVALDRPVAAYDLQLHLLAHSPHPDVDRVRTDGILRRDVSPAVRGWVTRLGLSNAGRWLRTEPDAELGMKARVGVPIRCQGLLLGSLWIVDEQQSLTDAQLELAAGHAAEIGDLRYRERLLEHDRGRRESELVGDVIGPDPARRAAAAEALRHEGFLVSASQVLVVAIGAVGPPDAVASDAVAIAAAATVTRLRRGLAPRHLAARGDADGWTAVVAMPGSWKDEVERVGARLERAAQTAFDDVAGSHVVLGASGPVALDAAARGRREAWRSLELARRTGRHGTMIRWERLGSDRLVTAILDGTADVDELVPAEVRALIEHPDSELLVATLGRYLDLAGDAARAAAELFIHRTTLYQRLRRVERITGLSLRDGDDRLVLQLSLRLWALRAADQDALASSATPSATERRHASTLRNLMSS